MDDQDHLINMFAGREHGPVFNAPWQAQVFAMTVRLYQNGKFSWPEWSERLGHEIKLAEKQGKPDTEDTYYECWLQAFEKLVAGKNLTSEAELAARRDDWDCAARSTPHGRTITLDILERERTGN